MLKDRVFSQRTIHALVAYAIVILQGTLILTSVKRATVVSKSIISLSWPINV
ncbi:unnamed protein product, partial [Allacma fusca]